MQSVSPAYESVIQFAVDDSVGAFVAKTREVLAWDFNRRRDEYQKIRGWFETNKKWDVLAPGLSLWLENQARKVVDKFEANPCQSVKSVVIKKTSKEIL